MISARRNVYKAVPLSVKIMKSHIIKQLLKVLFPEFFLGKKFFYYFWHV